MSDEAPDLLSYLALETKRVQVLEDDTVPIVLGKHPDVMQLTPHVKQVVLKRLHKARANLSEKTRSNFLSFSPSSLFRLLARVHAHAVSVCLSVCTISVLLVLSNSLRPTPSLCLFVSLYLTSSSVAHSPLLPLFFSSPDTRMTKRNRKCERSKHISWTPSREEFPSRESRSAKT